MTALDYSPVTEKTGDWVTREAVSMLYTRYRYASDFCRGKRVLEVACGQAIGLRYLAQHAEHAVGGDFTKELLASARRSLQSTLPLVRLHAEALPMSTASRDVIVCYEAIYYFEHPSRFLQECRRVLAPQGLLLLCTVNPEWPDFNPSPHSRGYYSLRQLSALLQEAGFQTEAYGAFPVLGGSIWTACVSRIKRAAIALDMIPFTMSRKRWLKRLFLGRLVPFPPAVLDGMATYLPPVAISPNRPAAGHKILFAVGRLI